ncbi:MAG TPA: adenylate/guanylate cyclase domain-containing protein [Acidimicrobiia bacterium]|nr:adenylate/guanylate cyclase domain-containing protein [Acidimicrobiia bacterium]
MSDADPGIEAALRALRDQVAAQGEMLRAVHDEIQALGRTTGDDLWQRLGLADGERRRVTVLFADITGYTALAEAMDADEMAATLRDTLSALAACVRDQGGHVEKFIGDAVCAIYGAPEAHENEPERGVRSALAMHALMASRALDRPDLPAMEVHIGIHTGLVVAGPVADGSQVGVMGDTVNTAARLMDAAAPGHTLISADTARWVRRGFLLEDAGDLVLKNKATAVGAALVVRELDAGEATGDRELNAPLVGRDAEMDLLRETAAGVVATGSGATVVLTGEPGAGKARVLAELAAECSRDMQVLSASAANTERRAFGVLAAALVPLVESAPAGPDRDAVQGLYDLDDAPPDLWDAVVRLVRERAAARSLAVLLADLEAADAASLERLRFLVQATAASPVLWVGSGRRGVLGLQALASEPNVTAIALPLLGDAAVSDLFEAMLPGALTREQREQLAGRAAGNPEFATELALALVDDGVVVEAGDGRWTLVGDPDRLAIPPTVHEFLEARIDGLPDHARMALQEAAVIGEQFRWDVLNKITAAPAMLDAALAELVAAELVRPPGVVGQPGVYAFRGSLVQEVAYAGILDARRAAIHGRVAETKLRLHADDPTPIAARVAFHFDAAGDTEQALTYLVTAAEAAAATGADASLADLVARGLELCAARPGAFPEHEARLSAWGAGARLATKPA